MTNSEELKKIEELLKNVERGDNEPIILVRYGFKLLELDGKTYLTPKTERDVIASIMSEKNLTLDDARAEFEKMQTTPWCWGNGRGECIPRDGCRSCTPFSDGGTGWDCRCD